MLRPKERQAYDTLAHGLQTVKEHFSLPSFCFHSANQALQAIQMDIPDLFYLDFSSITITTSGFMAQCYPHFLDSPKECLRKRQAIQQLGQQFVSSISHLPPLDRELAIVDYLATHVTYGILPGADEARSSTMEGALLKKKAVCIGYARAFTFLCRLAEIPAMMIGGTLLSRPAEGHCWNLVEIGGVTYHVDVTNTFTHGAFVSRGLVNLSDAQVRSILRPSGNYPLPACPAGMNLVPMAKGTTELLQQLRRGVQAGKPVFEIAINHHFNSVQELVSFIEHRLIPADYSWYNRIKSYGYNQRDVIAVIMR